MLCYSQDELRISSSFVHAWLYSRNIVEQSPLYEILSYNSLKSSHYISLSVLCCVPTLKSLCSHHMMYYIISNRYHQGASGCCCC